MQNSEKSIFELYELVDKLNAEADKCIKNINIVREKGINAIRKAEGVFTPNIQEKEKDQTRQAVIKLIESLVEINCDLELTDDVSDNLVIPYISLENNPIQLKFLAGDNPWNFWLFDDNVDTRTIHKNLLKKYQNDLLETHPNPKPQESVCFLDRNKVYRGLVLQIIHGDRVKILDYDNNICKVVSSDRVFKADPDACHIHASSLRCTITEDSEGAKLWNSELRDIFCNALREAVLHVNILKKLDETFPIFLVDVEMQNEDEPFRSSLKEWIIGRLLPELKKLSITENGTLNDFLSCEVLNPFYKENNCGIKQDVINTENTVKVNILETHTKSGLSVNDDVSNVCNDVSNLNVMNDQKLLKKDDPNLDILDDKKQLTFGKHDFGVIMSRFEDDLVSSTVFDNEVNPMGLDKKQALESSFINETEVKSIGKLNSSSSVFKPTKTCLSPVTMEQSKPDYLSLMEPRICSVYNPSQQTIYPATYGNSAAFHPSDRHPSVAPSYWAYKGVPVYKNQPDVWNNSNVPQPNKFSQTSHVLQPLHVPRPEFLQHQPIPQNSHFVQSPHFPHPTHLSPSPYRPQPSFNPQPSFGRKVSHMPPTIITHTLYTPNFSQSHATDNDSKNPQGMSETTWSSGEDFKSDLDKDENSGNVKATNINNINVNVNVMAPEFIPKNTNDNKKDIDKIQQKSDENINSDRRYNISVLSSADEIIHIELRKPRSLLQPGENLLVMIAHVESPAEFYVHFITNNNQYLDKLHDDMFNHYTTKEKISFSSWKEAKNILGKFCACKWLEDNHWYRVEVLDWALGENKVKVYFVDYGNIDTVNLTCLQPLMKQFAKLSMCAQPCHLAQVYPLDKKETWSVTAIDFFKSVVEVSNSHVYSVTVVPSKKQDVKINNSLSVLLYEGKATEDSKSVNEQLVDCGLAWSKKFIKQSQSSESDVYYSLDELSQFSDTTNKSIDDKQTLGIQSKDVQTIGFTATEEEDEWEKWDPQEEDYNSPRNNPRIDTDDAGVALTGYTARDEARICKFYAQSGRCWKKLCLKEHSRPNKDGVTTDREEVYLRAFSEISLPSVGEVIPVRVTAVSSISFFYVQLLENKGINIDDDDAETITTLHEFMNKLENVQKMKHLKVPPALGQLVLAKYDDQWFRARVISTDDEPEVMFLDYGSVCTVTEKDLREIECRYLHLPFQAIECSIANIIPPKPGSEDYEKGTELLRELIETGILTAKVYDSSCGETFQRMELVLTDKEYKDIGEYLIANGYAERKNIIWNNVSCSNLINFYPG